jgi:predicted esterase
MIDYVGETGLIPNMIVVGIFDTRYFRDMFPKKLEQRPDDTGGSDSFLEFIEKDLQPYIDKNYRTNGFNILHGASNAGMLTVYALLARPGLFSAYISSSPMLGWYPEYFPELATNRISKQDVADKFLYMIYGKYDYDRVVTEVPKFVEVLEKLAPKQFQWKLELLENEGHVPYTSLYSGLRTLFPKWRVSDKEVTSMGLQGLEQYYADLSSKYGFDVMIPEDVLTTLGFEYYREEKMDEAIATMNVAIERYPTSDGALGFLGALYNRNNESDQAKKCLHKALELNPENIRAKEILQKIESSDK